MIKPQLIINGNNFHDLESFFNQIDNIFTKNLEFKTGHNLNAFNDILRGGFGVYEYEESVKITWINFSISQERLGMELVTILIQLIKEHPHIEFETKG